MASQQPFFETYEVRTLSIGSKSHVFLKFNPKDILCQVDNLLEFIEPISIVDEDGNDISSTTKNLIEEKIIKCTNVRGKKRQIIKSRKKLENLMANKLITALCDNSKFFVLMMEKPFK